MSDAPKAHKSDRNFHARVPTVAYGYLEVNADTYDEFADRLKDVLEIKEEFFSEAIEEENKPKSRSTDRGSSRSETRSSSRGGGSRGGSKANYKKLGVWDETGEEVIVEFEGQHGPYVKAGLETSDGRKVYASLGKNEDPEDVDFDRAVELLEERLEYMEGQGKSGGGSRGGSGGRRGGRGYNR